jgi:hypothetical protein
MHFFPCAAFWRRWVTKNKHPGVDGNFSGGFLSKGNLLIIDSRWLVLL